MLAGLQRRIILAFLLGNRDRFVDRLSVSYAGDAQRVDQLVYQRTDKHQAFGTNEAGFPYLSCKAERPGVHCGSQTSRIE